VPAKNLSDVSRDSKKLHADLGRVKDVDKHRHAEKEEKAESDEYGMKMIP
jgi:hypothetical protein